MKLGPPWPSCRGACSVPADRCLPRDPVLLSLSTSLAGTPPAPGSQAEGPRSPPPALSCTSQPHRSQRTLAISSQASPQFLRRPRTRGRMLSWFLLALESWPPSPPAQSPCVLISCLLEGDIVSVIAPAANVTVSPTSSAPGVPSSLTIEEEGAGPDTCVWVHLGTGGNRAGCPLPSGRDTLPGPLAAIVIASREEGTRSPGLGVSLREQGRRGVAGRSPHSALPAAGRQGLAPPAPPGSAFAEGQGDRPSC